MSVARCFSCLKLVTECRTDTKCSVAKTGLHSIVDMDDRTLLHVTETHAHFGERIDCPWCGSTHSDLWDHEWGSRESIELECDNCGKPYELNRAVSVSYTATRVIKKVVPT